MKKWELISLTSDKPINKWTPQGELDVAWEFASEDEARQAAIKIGYTEGLKGYFYMNVTNRYDKKPVAIKLRSKEITNGKEETVS